MGESKDRLIQQQIEDDKERQSEEPWTEERRKVVPSQTNTQYDPDHLNPDKGGNRAGDDYW